MIYHGRNPCSGCQEADLSSEGYCLALLQELLSQEAALSSALMPGLWRGGEMAHVLASMGDGMGDSIPASRFKPSFVLVL